MLNKIPKTLVVIILLITFTTNITFAGEWVLKKKDPQKAKKLAIFPGLIFTGAPSFYLGNKGEGIFQTEVDIISIFLVYYSYTQMKLYPDFTNGWLYGYLLLTGVTGMAYGRIENILNSKKKTNEWNEAIENENFSGIKKRLTNYYKLNLIYGGPFLILGIGSLFSPKTTPLVSAVVLSGIGCILLSIGIISKTQANRLDKAVFEQKKALIPSLTLCPMIRPDCSGIMLVKRF